MFRYDRFNKSELIECYKKSTIVNNVILIPKFGLEVYLEGVTELQESDFEINKDIILEAIINIPKFDNDVQKSLENSYKNSNLHIRNFMFSLAYLEVSRDKIRLGYWGDEVNSEFDEIFIKNQDEWVIQTKRL